MLSAFDSNYRIEQLLSLMKNASQDVGRVLLTNLWKDPRESQESDIIKMLLKQKQCHISLITGFVESYRITREPV
jgi:hypothetical protein